MARVTPLPSLLQGPVEQRKARLEAEMADLQARLRGVPSWSTYDGERRRLSEALARRRRRLAMLKEGDGGNGR